MILAKGAGPRLGGLGLLLSTLSCQTLVVGWGADDPEGGTSSASANPARSKVLFVADLQNTDVAPWDSEVAKHFASAGLDVAWVDHRASDLPLTDGVALIAVSSSVESDVLIPSIARATVPVLCMESYSFDNLGMTGAMLNTDYGVAPIAVADLVDDFPAVPNARGPFSLVTSNAAWSNFGTPGDAARVVARRQDVPHTAVLFGYEKGQAMPGGPAPARRIGIFLRSENWASTSEEARSLFDRAVEWGITPSAKALNW